MELMSPGFEEQRLPVVLWCMAQGRQSDYSQEQGVNPWALEVQDSFTTCYLALRSLKFV